MSHELFSPKQPTTSTHVKRILWMKQLTFRSCATSKNRACERGERPAGGGRGGSVTRHDEHARRVEGRARTDGQLDPEGRRP